MSNYQLIIQKIQQFTRKYYANELLRGSMMFLSLGLLYFIFTLFVEYFLWLKPTYRTLLFWIFISIEALLLYRFIIIPLFKILGLRKGITHKQASLLIGKYFPEIDDKLLNMLQLHDSHPDSELVLASIDQKALHLKPFTFQNAIDFTHNKKYIKYLLIPIVVWLLTLITGNKEMFSGSYDRLVHHQKEYSPPAPFAFKLLNSNLRVVEGKPIELKVTTMGNTIPEEVYILYNDQKYLLQQSGFNEFVYTFNEVKHSFGFYFEANEVQSIDYQVEVIPIPQIQSIKMLLHYPAHLQKQDEVIENTGNAHIPEGTHVTWQIIAQNTTLVFLNDTLHKQAFAFNENNQNFLLSKQIRNPYQYSISTSNNQLKDYENLPFSITVIKDAFPEMHIETDIDSLKIGPAHFVGRISDDYGLTKLQVVYYAIKNPENKSVQVIPIKNAVLSDFYFEFPAHLKLTDGVDYEFYFEVFDNDRVNGLKSVKSKTYSYHKDSETEYQEKLLEQQGENIDQLDKLLDKQEKNQKELDALQKQLQNKSEINFNETQELQNLLKRQQQYEEMMQRQTDELKEHLNQQPDTDNDRLNQKKEDIQKRIDELKQSEEQKKLLEELQKLAEKLQKEDLLDQIKKMSSNSKSKEKTLEQLLELTKRFYVEQKAQQIAEKLDDLAKKQQDLKESSQNSKPEQDKLNEKFDKIREDMKEMMKQNSELKKPMELDEHKPDQESIKQDMQKASDQLQQQQKSGAQKTQQSAANKMKQMSQSMKQMMMEMQGDMITEDIATIRRVVKNLITFSYQQEELMDILKNEEQSGTNLSVNLKKQNLLKTYFEHIDDSLYTLSMRQEKLSHHINEYLENAHYYLDEANQSLSENQIAKTRSNQQFVMTAANDLASLLASLLDNLKNQQMSMGQGQGEGNMPFSLPDIIQKQGDIKQRMQNMLKEQGQETPSQQGQDKEGKNGEKKQSDGEKQSKELYEIYKEQARLREALEEQLENLKGSGMDKQASNVLRQMEQLEQMLLEKGITNEVLQRMLRMEHELLKLKDATYQQGMEQKRISKSGDDDHQTISPEKLEEFYKKLNQQELLNRDPFPFKPNINQKVIHYFNQKQTTHD